MTRPSPDRHTRRPRSPYAVRPTMERLEDRTVPSGRGWALEADPEGDVFHDVNGNGTRDAGESTVGAGWQVYVDTNENGALDAGEVNVLTDATGHYNVVLPDGTYSIRVVPQSPFQDDRRPLGTVLRDFASIEGEQSNYSGLAWVNESLYVTFNRQFGVNDNVMYQADPVTGEALGSAVPIPGDIGEITFDGTDFWGADWVNNYLIRFNSAGVELDRLSFPGMNTNSVEWDGAALRVLDRVAGRIYKIDPAGDGTILPGTISTPPENCGGLAFDGEYLWVNGRDSKRVYALDPATGSVKREFTHYGVFAYGLTIRGTNLWVSDSHASRVYQYDLGYGGGRIVTVAGAPVAGVDLAVFQLGSVSGRVFNDNNHNGTQDANDGGLAGWRVYVDSDANGRFDTWETSTVSDAFGNYTVSGLRPGPNTVVLDFAGQRQFRWSSVIPTSGNQSVALNSGEALSGMNFANFLDRTTPISPSHWGTFAGGEMSLYTGLSWVDFSALQPLEPTFDGALTFAANSTHGSYDDWRVPTKTEAQYAAINGVGPRLNSGGYASPNFHYWTSTASTKKLAWVVALHDPTGHATETSNTLSHHALAGIRDAGLVIDDGEMGYSELGFVGVSSKNASGAYQNDQRSASAGNGSKTATYTFTGLEPGATYKIDITWKPVSGAATNAPFTILSGATVLGTRAINQAVAPNDFTIADTTSWEGLGAYTLTGNSLTVRLSNLANGTVIADAVRIFKLLPSYAPPAPLTAAGVAPLGHDPGRALTTAVVRPLLNEAVRRWTAAGADVSALAGLDLRVANLGGATLGLASGQTVWLDDDAAGWGWFLDPTPAGDVEFRTPGDQGEQGRMDLLTALVHELGHVLGLDHDEGGAMSEALAAGQRLDLHGVRVAPDFASVAPFAGGDDMSPLVSGRRML